MPNSYDKVIEAKTLYNLRMMQALVSIGSFCYLVT